MLSKSGITSRTVTFILAGGNGKRLRPLTLNRAKPLVPFYGKFRLIDFTVSNCFNSNLRNVYPLIQHKHAPVQQYVERASAGTEGGFSSKPTMLKCLTPKPGWLYSGTADAVLQNLWVLEREAPQFVLILCADHVYKMDYTRLLRCHADSGAQLTIAAIEYPRRMASAFGVLEMTPQGEVLGFEENPAGAKSLSVDGDAALVSMGIYVFSTGTLIRALIEDASRLKSTHDFGTDIIPALIGRVPVHAHNVTATAGNGGQYWRDISSVDDYYRTQMELLVVDPPFAPCREAICATHGLAESGPPDSVISRHSTTWGASIIHSIISRGVHVEPGAEIESSILLPGARIGRGARIRHAVVGEHAIIAEDAEIGYTPDSDRQQFQLSSGGVVVVPPEIDLSTINCATFAF